jgi:alanyl-tRNA synthetase
MLGCMRWSTDNIRKSFLDFFKERGHQIVLSASLIPKGDPTLLFTNAGMVAFKDYFLGIRTPAAPRVADCQKCLRISGKHNDLEAVGRDTYHHTFLEMLGNWSFGDYYKSEAIAWHWELITKVWEINPKLLYATVHDGDDEAAQIWKKLGVLPNDRILKFGDHDNFWEMGSSGPCGPNSEINVDRGGGACDGSAHPGVECFVNVDGCSRFVELGNLVFIQFNRDESGKLTPLPKKHVDTGTGLERVAAVLQGFEQDKLLGNYDIDVFQVTIKEIEKFVTSVGNFSRYGKDYQSDISYRAIADHARAISFLIADGLRPGRDDREYILRMLIRRAARHGRRLGVEMLDPMLKAACSSVVRSMGAHYPELNSAAIDRVVGEEMARFESTLAVGESYLQQAVNALRDKASRKSSTRMESQPSPGGESTERRETLPGEVAFKAYDTYGLPLEVTQDILRDEDITVDLESFNRLMAEQRERARASRKEGAAGSEIKIGAGLESRFLGYDSYEADSEVLFGDGGDDQRLSIVTAETPFYAESGGQVGDRGAITAASGALMEVTDTRKAEGTIVHTGHLLRGDAREFAKGVRVHLRIDTRRRGATMLNHSATHILHYALRDVLGGGVHQAGSLVAPEKLRFDFNHTGKIAEGDLQTIEEEVNARIRENSEVVTEEMAYDDAIKAGALAFFGDKYGDRVRVLRMGDFSVELCGGTHVNHTGDIGVFRLDSESGVAAGVRRIEALTGQGAVESIRTRGKILNEIGSQLRAKDELALERLQRLLEREKQLERKIRELEKKLAAGSGTSTSADVDQVRNVNGIKLIVRKLDAVEPNAMREMADRLRQKHQSAVVALGSDLGQKVALLVAVTADLTGKIKAGEIVKQIAPIVGGSGGGKADLAQAGGRDPSKLQEALDKVADLLR